MAWFHRAQTIDDWPAQGVAFLDMLPCFGHDAALIRDEIRQRLAATIRDPAAHAFLGPELRGCLLAIIAAQAFPGSCAVSVRKAEKRPTANRHGMHVSAESYAKEYGAGDRLCISEADVPEHVRTVTLCDDLLATGGTLRSLNALVDAIGKWKVVSTFVLVRHDGLGEAMQAQQHAYVTGLRHPFIAAASLDAAGVVTALPVPTKPLAPDALRPQSLEQIASSLEHDTRILVMQSPGTDWGEKLAASYPAAFRYVPIDWKRWPDGFPNVHFAPYEFIEGHAVLYVMAMDNDAEVARNIAMAGVLSRQTTRGPFMVAIPYFGPGTMERADTSDVMATADPYARMLSGVVEPNTAVAIVDVHALQTRFYFQDRVRPHTLSAVPDILARIVLDTREAFLDEDMKHDTDSDNERDAYFPRSYTTIVFPDDGAAKRYGPLLREVHLRTGEEMTRIVCTKRRGPDGQRTIVIGETIDADVHKDKNIRYEETQWLIVDDICKSGGTLIETARALRSTAKHPIDVLVVHGVFENNAHLKFLKAHDEGLIGRVYLGTTLHARAQMLQSAYPKVFGALTHETPRCVAEWAVRMGGRPPSTLTDGVTIVLASKAKVKAEAVRLLVQDLARATSKRHWEDVVVIQCDPTDLLVTPTVAQPMGGSAVLNACAARVRAAEAFWSRYPDHHSNRRYVLFVALENGLIQDCKDARWYDYAAAGIKAIDRALPLVPSGPQFNVGSLVVSVPKEHEDLLLGIEGKGETFGQRLHARDPTTYPDAATWQAHVPSEDDPIPRERQLHEALLRAAKHVFSWGTQK